MNVNGLDTDRLTTFAAQFAGTPGAGAVCIGVRTSWKHAYTAETNTDELIVGGEQIPRGHALRIDLPDVFGGHDRAPVPGETLLAALSACVTHGLIEAAAMNGITIHRLDVRAQGHLDLRGSQGVDGVRAGLAGARLDFEVETDAADETLEALLEAAVRTSPVADSLRAVTIEASVRRLSGRRG